MIYNLYISGFKHGVISGVKKFREMASPLDEASRPKKPLKERAGPSAS